MQGLSFCVATFYFRFAGEGHNWWFPGIYRCQAFSETLAKTVPVLLGRASSLFCHVPTRPVRENLNPVFKEGPPFPLFLAMFGFSHGYKQFS